MTPLDAFGNPVTGVTAAQVQLWDGVVQAFLSHHAETADRIAALISVAPDCVIAPTCHGLFCLMLGRRELTAAAHEDLKTARAIAARVGCTARERMMIDALADYCAGRQQAVADRMDVLLAENPADVLALKIGHALRFILGDATGMRRSIEAVLPAYGSDHAAAGYVMGCHAFALEETGDYRQAERAGRLGQELAPDDAWGLHAVAHVYDMTGHPEEGADWLEPRADRWSHCNNFRYHVWWHLALFLMDQRKFDRVLELYDTHIRQDHTDDYRDISNGASMLARLEMEGVDVGSRWREMAELSTGRTEDGCVVFADLHYVMSMVGTCRDRSKIGVDCADAIAALLRRMERDAGPDRSATVFDQSEVLTAAGLDTARGLVAFAQHDWAEALRHLARAQPKLYTVGGSHAQRDVFDRYTIEAALRGGATSEAVHLLRERADRRGAWDRFGRDRMAALSAQSADVQAVPAE